MPGVTQQLCRMFQLQAYGTCKPSSSVPYARQPAAMLAVWHIVYCMPAALLLLLDACINFTESIPWLFSADHYPGLSPHTMCYTIPGTLVQHNRYSSTWYIRMIHYFSSTMSITYVHTIVFFAWNTISIKIPQTLPLMG